MPTVTVIQPKVADDTHRLLRVAAYCRVSSNSDDQLNSYNSQLTYYTHKFEDSETETLIDIYADEGITGTCEEKRTEFLRLIDDCRKGKIDRIYTKSISRFARNTRDCLKNIRELKSLGITIMFEKENIDTANITDELMLTIMGGLAEEESVSISLNMQWSIRRRMINGTYIASSCPYGYNKTNDTFVINEHEAVTVRRIFSEYLKGYGLNAICDNLNSDGIIMEKSGIVWKKKAVRYILNNEKYIGDCLWRKSYTQNVVPFKKKRNKCEAEQYYVTDHHEPIVSREIFEAVQILLNERGLYYGNTVFKEYPLSRKIICGKCGSIYKRKMVGAECKWVCANHEVKSQKCDCSYINQNVFYERFTCLFNKMLHNYNSILSPLKKSLQETEINRFTGDKNIIGLRRDILQLKEQLKVIATLHTKGFLNEAKFKEQSLEINNKIDKLSKDIRLLSQSDDTVLKQIEMLIDYFEKREHIMIEFESQAFEFLIDKIVVKDNILEFHIMGGLIFTEEI